MNTLLIGLLIGAGLIGVAYAYRVYSVRREEAKMKAEREAINDSLTGIGAMTGYSRNSSRQQNSKPAKAPLKAVPKSKVETTTANTPDDLMLFSAAYTSTTPTLTPVTYQEDDTRKFAGSGGTFDGGGASGNYDPAPTPSSSCDSGSSSSDSGSSYSSSSSDSSSSCSSSDSGSSGSSD